MRSVLFPLEKMVEGTWKNMNREGGKTRLQKIYYLSGRISERTHLLTKYVPKLLLQEERLAFHVTRRAIILLSGGEILNEQLLTRSE
jgi:hypothetical protein